MKKSRTSKNKSLNKDNNKPINQDFDTNVEHINGPINVIRLEGNVHGINKVIYLFMDVHLPVYDQTECSNIYSKDVNKYFAENFHALNNSDKKYDFFMEIRPTEILKLKNKYINRTDYPIGSIHREKYIEEMIRLFTNIFTYDYNKNVVGMAEHFNNIRLHYLDIRDYLKFHILGFFDRALGLSNNFLYNGINMQALTVIINSLLHGKKQLDMTIDILDKSVYKPTKKNPTIKKSYDKIIDPEIIANMSNKMKNIYTHADIKIKMNKLFNNLIVDFKKFSTFIGTNIDKIIAYQKIIFNSSSKFIRDDEYDKKISGRGLSPYKLRLITVDIINTCEKIYMDTIDIFADLTDIYFMRRFLDKDYITNTIVYSGYVHSDNYIRILLTQFDFKITHVSYSSIMDLDALDAEIKKRIKTDNNLTDLFNTINTVQCSDLTHFPKNFA